MNILAVESSCDETAVAIVRDGREVLCDCIASQVDLHRIYGGVVPELASRAHLQNIVPVVHQALAQAGVKKEDLNAVAFTRGPGLMGSLLVGTSFAKSFAQALGLPLIDVNHLQAHILANFIDEKDAEKLAKKTRLGELTLEDFLDQMQSMKKMGGIKSMLEMLPGMSGKDIEVDENAMKKPEAIIRSMTPRERRNPGILNASRRKRIAAGSGTTVQDVNALIRQFEQSKQMMKQMMSRKGKFGKMRMPF